MSSATPQITFCRSRLELNPGLLQNFALLVTLFLACISLNADPAPDLDTAMSLSADLDPDPDFAITLQVIIFVRSLSVSFFIEKEPHKQLRMKRKRRGER